jgi:hypothetical protein
MDPWKLLSTGSVICTWKEVASKKLRSTSRLNCSTKATWRFPLEQKEYLASELQAFFPVNPEMFTEIEFAANEEKSKMT